MDLSLFTSFEGRINRAKWWLGIIILLILQSIAISVITMIFGAGTIAVPPDDPAYMEQVMSNLWLPMTIVGILSLWFNLAVYAKRWHDRDKSGWWTLISIVPVIGFVWILVELGCLPRTEGPNRYGTDPLSA